MSVDFEYFIKEAVEKALADNPDYQFNSENLIVKVDRGNVTIKEADRDWVLETGLE